MDINFMQFLIFTILNIIKGTFNQFPEKRNALNGYNSAANGYDFVAE